jgi:hypothetical protein
VGVLPDPPELRIGDVDRRDHLLEQLLPWQLVTIVLLELIANTRLLRQRACEEAAVFVDVEPTLGLELGVGHELLWGLLESRLLDLLIRDHDPPPLVLLSQKDVIDEIVERRVFYTAFLIEGQGRGALLLRLADAPLAGAQPCVIRDIRSIDTGHGGTTGHRPASGEA